MTRWSTLCLAALTSGACLRCEGGVADRDADLGCSESCAASDMSVGCLVAVPNVSPSADIAVDASHAYFGRCLANGPGALLSVPLGGGATTTLATGAGCPVGIALAGATVYVAGLGGGKGDISSVPLGGGSPTTLASSADTPTGIAVDDANVYYVTKGGALMEVARGGGVPSVLAKCQAACTRPVVAGSSVFWGDTAAGTIMSVPREGGSPVMVTSGVEGVSSLSIATDIYFANGYFVGEASLVDGSVMQIGLPTGAPVLAVDADGTNVYFTSWSSIYRTASSDVEPTRIAVTQADPAAFTVDATSVYWTDGSASRCARVMKLTPK